MTMQTSEITADKAGEPDLFPLAHGKFRWLTRSKHKDLLFGPNGLRLEEWLGAGQATVIKKGPHRIVYRVDLPSISFYVKHNLIPDARTWVRELIRGSKGWNEARCAMRVASHGIATASILAVGQAKGVFGVGESFLITRSLDRTTQLNVFIESALSAFPPNRQIQIRIRLAAELGRFIAKLHHAGIIHNDLHCGNLLIQLDEYDKPTFYLIDLHNVRFGKPLGWKKSKANLVILNRWLLLRASRSDRRRFWESYLKERACVYAGWANTTLKSANCCEALQRSNKADRAREIEEATKLSNQQFWRRRQRRFLKVSRHIRRVKRQSLRGFAAADLDSDFLSDLLKNPDAPFDCPDTVILKESASAIVAEFTAVVAGIPRRVVYKRFNNVDKTDPFAAWFRPTPAVRSWIHGLCLRDRGLATPRPLAVFHRYRWGLCQEGFLLQEKANAVGDLKQALDELQTLESLKLRRKLRLRIDQLARLLRELHSRNLSHRDLKAANILLIAEVEQGSSSGIGNLQSVGITSPFCFIDLVGVAQRSRQSAKTRIKNLARLHASFFDDGRITRTDKLRFLREYLQWGLHGKEGWKQWWREIGKATRRKISKNRRGGRLLA